MNRQIMFSKLRTANFKTREDGDQMIVSGYFAVFDSNYEIWHGATESIDRHAFDCLLYTSMQISYLKQDTERV